MSEPHDPAAAGDEQLQAGHADREPVIETLAGVALRWPLTTAAVKSGGLLIIAFAMAYSGNLIDNAYPNDPGPGPHHGWTRFLFFLIVILMITACVTLGRGLVASVEQRRARRVLSPRPPGSRALDV
jgi:hypothetical protein